MKYAYDLFVKRFWSNLLVIVQLTIAVLLVNGLILQLKNIYASSSVIRNIQNQSIVWIGTTPDNAQNITSIDTNGMEGLQSRLLTSYGEAVVDDRLQTVFLSYSPELFDLLSLPLQKGQWNAPIKDGNIPLYLLQNPLSLRVGESVRVRINGHDLAGYVAGVVSGGQYFSLGSSGNPMMASNFWKRSAASFDPGFIISDTYIKQAYGAEPLSYGLGSFLVFDPDISAETMAQNMEELSRQTWVASASDILENSREEIREYNRLYYPLIACIVAIAFFALLSINVLASVNNLHDYAVFYLCGLPRRRIERIGLQFALIIVGISLCIVSTAGFLSSLGGMWVDNGWVLGMDNILVTLAVYGFSVAVLWLVQHKTLAGNSLIRIIYQYE